jgi:hypothetical protein
MIRILKKLLYIRYNVSLNERLNLVKLNKPNRDRIFCSFAVITAIIRFFLFGLFYFNLPALWREYVYKGASL